MGGQGNNGATSYANHNGIVGMTFQGYNFANSDPAHHHMECIHDTPGSDHITIAGNRILNCPVQSFFAQGTTQTNILVENNYFDTGGPLKFDCTTNPGCVNQNITVRYNSFHATTLLLENACNVNNTCAGATIDNNHVYANIGDGCPTVNFGLGGSTGSGWTSSGYNVEKTATARNLHKRHNQRLQPNNHLHLTRSTNLQPRPKRHPNRHRIRTRIVEPPRN